MKLLHQRILLAGVLALAIAVTILSQGALHSGGNPVQEIPIGNTLQVSVVGRLQNTNILTADQNAGRAPFLALNESLRDPSGTNIFVVKLANAGNSAVWLRCFNSSFPWYFLSTRSANRWQRLPLRYTSSTALLALQPKQTMTFPIDVPTRQQVDFPVGEAVGLELNYTETPSRNRLRDFWNRYCGFLALKPIGGRERFYTTGVIEIHE